ncbi:MAG: HPr family phosphocarrier protein [Gemmatimonadota bacterium]
MASVSEERDSGREEMRERVATVEIVNREGLHARPAAEFVKLASRFVAEVWVEKDGLEVNGKSIMGVLMLAAEPGSEIRIRVVGEDGEEALRKLVALVRDGFGEDLARPQGSERSESGRG